jgi:flagellar protein FlbD
MIKLTSLKGSEFYLNADLIERVEELPDTLITLIGGKKIWVSERAETVVDRIIYYKRSIHGPQEEVKL